MRGLHDSDLLLVTDGLGPIERLLIDELRSRGVTPFPLSLIDAELEPSRAAAAVLVGDAVKAYAVSALFERAANPPRAYELTINRLLLYRELGDKSPRPVVAFAPEPVSNAIRRRGLRYIGALTPSLGLDGAVTGWAGGKSVAEHRLYIDNPLAKVNVLIPEPASIVKARVIGGECSGCAGLEEQAIYAAERAGCVFCDVFLGVDGDEPPLVIGLNASIEVTSEAVHPLAAALARWLHG